MPPPVWQIINADAREALRALPAESVHCVITSPPYWGLRVYKGVPPLIWGGKPAHRHRWGASLEHGRRGRRGVSGTGGNLNPALDAHGTGPGAGGGGELCRCGAWRGDLGLEPTPEMYVAHLVEVFEEVRRVLRPDGVLWLNLGDCYSGSMGECGRHDPEKPSGRRGQLDPCIPPPGSKTILPNKNLMGMPWRVAFALQAAGWYLRRDVIWEKSNPLPESTRDRPVTAHEYLFLLSRNARYFYDCEAVRKPSGTASKPACLIPNPKRGQRLERNRSNELLADRMRPMRARYSNPAGHHLRSVWRIPTERYDGNHFATFPRRLVEPPILATTSAQGGCSTCGAPWVRRLAQKRTSIDPTAHRSFLHGYNQGLNRKPGERKPRRFYTIEWETVGWRATCTCKENAPVPCTVLDPFCGSGRTGAAAISLGRSFIGIELHPEYATWAREALSRTRPPAARQQPLHLLAPTPAAATPPAPSQFPLFGSPEAP